MKSTSRITLSGQSSSACFGARLRRFVLQQVAAASANTASTSTSFRVLQQMAAGRRVEEKEKEHAKSARVIKELDELYEGLEDVFCESTMHV